MRRPCRSEKIESCDRTAKEASLLIRKFKIALFVGVYCPGLIDAAKGILYFCSLLLFPYLFPREQAKVKFLVMVFRCNIQFLIFMSENRLSGCSNSINHKAGCKDV